MLDIELTLLCQRMLMCEQSQSQIYLKDRNNTTEEEGEFPSLEFFVLSSCHNKEFYR